ncbi:phosphate signaling complex protein PhoU [bacterium]|nr:phosphate signaling complex protein PhoU [bacterium]
MTSRLQHELNQLKKSVLTLGAAVEDGLHRAVKALQERDEKIAQKIIESDHEIDNMEVDLEEECLKLLALHQPVATDLRFIVAVLKINNDLERIGDLSVNIAERAKFLAFQPPVNLPLDFRSMADAVQKMLKKSLDALVNMDEQLAGEVIDTDDRVDNMNRDMYQQIQEAIIKNPGQIESLIHLLSTSRHLERIADQTTNIAEDVIYMIKGEIVRHKTEEYQHKKK